MLTKLVILLNEYRQPVDPFSYCKQVGKFLRFPNYVNQQIKRLFYRLSNSTTPVNQINETGKRNPLD